VPVLARLFRRLFLEALVKAFDAGKLRFFSSLEPLRLRPAFLRHLRLARKTECVVYAKPPFAGDPDDVLKYVARYTHRVAISNDRILDIKDGEVRFRWKDYRDDGRSKTMALAAEESRRIRVPFQPAFSTRQDGRASRSYRHAHKTKAIQGFYSGGDIGVIRKLYSPILFCGYRHVLL
jgi:hypothetical protein